MAGGRRWIERGGRKTIGEAGEVDSTWPVRGGVALGWGKKWIARGRLGVG